MSLLLASTPVAAQSPRSFELQQFRPLGGTHDVLGLGSAQIATRGEIGYRLLMHWSHQPLRVVDANSGNTELVLVGDTLEGDLGFGFSPVRRLETFAVVPLVLYQDNLSTPQIVGLEERAVTGGVGDLRLGAKAHLWGGGGFLLAGGATATLPTARADSYLGYGTPTFTPRVLAEYEHSGLRLLANFGLTLRESRELLNLSLGTAFVYGAGAEWKLPIAGQDLALQGTLTGERNLDAPSVEEQPAELDVAVSWRAHSSLYLTAGAGRGLNKGYGTPRWRAMTGVTYAPAGRYRPRPRAQRPPDGGARLTGDKIELDEAVQFKMDDAALLERSKRVLDRVASLLEEHPEITRLRIEGHTDDVGRSEYNQELSERRAHAVRDYLVGRGIAAERLEAVGYGETQPLLDAVTPGARAMNRRVELTIVAREDS